LPFPYLDTLRNFNHLLTHILGVTLFLLGHAMPYMIPYYQSGLLVTFRCTDCDWTYTIQNPRSTPVPHDEEEKAKEQYVAHRCSECSSKRRRSSWHKKTAWKVAAGAFFSSRFLRRMLTPHRVRHDKSPTVGPPARQNHRFTATLFPVLRFVAVKRFWFHNWQRFRAQPLP
jgi:hypothetical protein